MFLTRQLRRRTGDLFQQTVGRESHPVAWRDVLRALRTLEPRDEVRSGRFVSDLSGEPYALPESVELLRRVRQDGPSAAIEVSSADPLNFLDARAPRPSLSLRVRLG